MDRNLKTTKVNKMKQQRSKFNWMIDAVLFIGFILLFFLNLTGLALHQWIGIAGGALALYHLITHWDWVEAVTKRFFGRTSSRVPPVLPGRCRNPDRIRGYSFERIGNFNLVVDKPDQPFCLD